LTKRAKRVVSLSVWLAAIWMPLAGCHSVSGTSVLFSNTSTEEVKAAYIHVLTSKVHPSRIDAGFDPVVTELRLRRYCAALKVVAKNSSQKKTGQNRFGDYVPRKKGLLLFDECVPGRFWTNGVCRAEWSRVTNMLPSIGFVRKEEAAVSKESDGRVKLTVSHWYRDTFIGSVLVGRMFSWLWNTDPLAEKRRIAAVKKQLLLQARRG